LSHKLLLVNHYYSWFTFLQLSILWGAGFFMVKYIVPGR
jgi:hypothetical protein